MIMARTIIAVAVSAPAFALAQAACPLLGPGQIGLGQYCKAVLAPPNESAAGTAHATSSIAAANTAGQPANAGTVGAQAPTPTASQPPSKSWRIEPADGRLANAFDRWARAEGMRMVWDARQHVSISAGDSFDGTLQDALTRVLSSPAIKNAYPLEVCFYPNNPPVMRITEIGEQKGCAQ